MHNELTIKIGSQERKAFLQDGFYTNISPSNHLHKHNYTEVHLVSGGQALFNVGGSMYSTDGDTMLVIPSGTFHSCSAMDTGMRHSAFQITCSVDRFTVHNIDSGIIPSFFEEIRKSEKSTDYTIVCAYIALFGSHFFAEEKISAHQISDYGFLIYEFFSKRYGSDVRLSDLAKVLCLSERQTERLVIEHTGNTFRQELAATRIVMAKHILASSDLSLEEIARYVGYRSYSGFWKSMKKYELPRKE